MATLLFRVGGHMETTAEPTLAVTGATGHLGGLVARALAERGIAQRLLVRDPSRAPQLPGAVAVQASYEDVAALTEALQGVETVLFVSGHEGPGRMAQHRAAIEAFVAAGVQRVVYTSFLGAAPQASFTYARDHFETEQLIRRSGLGFTFLRPVSTWTTWRTGPTTRASSVDRRVRAASPGWPARTLPRWPSQPCWTNPWRAGRSTSPGRG